ncbi:HAD-IB family hydrolase [Streptomyces sp. NPDC101776]|uniref:HAD-IB family hydrolase n=1 Tax=Streptomyces sp. NPDC101776 TaxID=3366146 RepID=UPI0037FC9E8D
MSNAKGFNAAEGRSVGSVDTSPRHYVFSDVDETLISRKSMFDFLSFYFTRRYGPEGARRATAVQEDLAARAAAGVRREAASRTYYRSWAGESASGVTLEGIQWHRERSADSDFYVPETCAALARHRAEGAAVVLVSGAFPAVLGPIAHDVGAAQVLCTVPEERDGVLTGEIVGRPMLGTGKRKAVRALLRDNPRVDPADCFAYGDHISDLPMLAEVGHPVIVGTSKELMAALPTAQRLEAG